jgi:predicted ribosomally synthesized peptide with nif11-like leader
MSIESAKAFIDRMKTDEDFSRQVRSCKDAESRMSFVKASKFDFSTEEIKKVQLELSDEELEKVAGGHEGHCGCYQDNPDVHME